MNLIEYSEIALSPCNGHSKQWRQLTHVREVLCLEFFDRQRPLSDTHLVSTSRGGGGLLWVEAV